VKFLLPENILKMQLVGFVDFLIINITVWWWYSLLSAFVRAVSEQFDLKDWELFWITVYIILSISDRILVY